VNLLRFLVGVHVSRRAANEGFIRLNLTGHFIDRSGVLRVANPVHHEPRCLLGHLKSAGDLVRRYAILAVGKHPHRAEPLIEGNGGILEDGSDLNRKLLVAPHTLPHEPRLQKGMLLAATTRAYRLAFGPFYGSNFLNAGEWVTVVPYRRHQATEFVDVDV